MRQGRRVLWVSGEGTIDLSLRKVLSDVGMRVHVVQGCAAARQALADGRVPSVVLCDTSLQDGTWSDVLALARAGALQIPVIVVSRVVDVKLYISVLERGAADFIAPPFYSRDVAHVLKCAVREDVAIQTPAAA